MNKKVIIYDIDNGDNSLPPENLGQLVPWLYYQLRSIPVEFHGSAKVEMIATESYGCPELSYEISYERPETDEETEARGNQDREREERQFRDALETIGRLRQRYGL